MPSQPRAWHEERRFLLRCELDAAYFHLYGIARDDVGHIMDTFPIVGARRMRSVRPGQGKPLMLGEQSIYEGDRCGHFGITVCLSGLT